VSEAEDSDDFPPSWSSEELKGVYTIAYPHWSADDQYISFSNGYYEGSNVKIYDLVNDKIISLLPEGLKFFGTTYRMQWANNVSSYVLANAGGYSDAGLFVGQEENLGSPVDYAQFVKAGGAYQSANISSDGKKVLTLYKNSFEDLEYKIALLDLDSKTSREITYTEGNFPFFGTDNNYIYYIDESDGNTLVQYSLLDNLVSKTIALPDNFNRFEKIGLTSDGHIELWASVSENGLTVASNTNQLVVIDPNTLSIVYTSKIITGFTTFLGFTD
jgi:hypothetical protein